MSKVTEKEFAARLDATAQLENAKDKSFVPPGAIFDIRADPRLPDFDKHNLEEWVREIIEAKAEIKRLKEIIDSDDKTGRTGLCDRVAAVLALHGIEKAKFEGYSLRPAGGTNEYIQRDLLLAQGVDPEVIKAATKSTNYSYLDIRELKGAKSQAMMAGMVASKPGRRSKGRDIAAGK